MEPREIAVRTARIVRHAQAVARECDPWMEGSTIEAMRAALEILGVDPAVIDAAAMMLDGESEDDGEASE